MWGALGHRSQLWGVALIIKGSHLTITVARGSGTKEKVGGLTLPLNDCTEAYGVSIVRNFMILHALRCTFWCNSNAGCAVTMPSQCITKEDIQTRAISLSICLSLSLSRSVSPLSLSLSLTHTLSVSLKTYPCFFPTGLWKSGGA